MNRYHAVTALVLLRHLSILTLLAVVFLATAASADVVYTFSGTSSAFGAVSFTVTLPSLMADNSSVVPTVIAANCGAAINDYGCTPTPVTLCGDLCFFDLAEAFDEVSLRTCTDVACLGPFGFAGFLFADGTLESFGTFTTVPNVQGQRVDPGTLTISEVVPEPSSLLLLGTGLFGPIRRKLLPHWKR